MHDEHEQPSAIDRIEPLLASLTGSRPAIFLDYDGTLTPIVPRPEDAVLSPRMRSLLSRLGRAYCVAIVSGRDRKDVANLVGLDHLIYAGSHGFDISGPDGFVFQHEIGRHCLPSLDAAQEKLSRSVGTLPGTQLERKRFALAIHYRNAAADSAPRIRQLVEEALADAAGLRLTEGKKVLELRPDVEWDKGKAVAFLLGRLEGRTGPLSPIYIGDDLTDEDAFAFVSERGIGILVGQHGQPTCARWHLLDSTEVAQFLTRMLNRVVGSD